MMLIYCIMLICLYIYLKKTYFKEHISAVAFKYNICDMRNNTWEFKLCLVFKQSSNGKGMVYSPSGPALPSNFYGPVGTDDWNVTFFLVIIDQVECVLQYLRQKRIFLAGQVWLFCNQPQWERGSFSRTVTLRDFDKPYYKPQ